MSQMPPLSLLREEDFPSQQSWIGKLFFTLNPVLTSLNQIINGGVVPNDNILVQDYLLDFTYQSQKDFPQTFTKTLTIAPKGLLILSALEAGNPVSIAPPPWQLTQQGQVSIADLVKLSNGAASTLSPGQHYQIQFRLTP